MLLRAEVHTPPQLEGDIGQFLAGCVQSLLIGCAAYLASAPVAPYKGILVGRATLSLPPGFAARLSAAQKAAVCRRRISSRRSARHTDWGTRPLTGYWVKVVGDAASYMTDRNEHFQIPELPSDAKTLAFYQQLCDSCLCYVVVLHPGEG